MWLFCLLPCGAYVIYVRTYSFVPDKWVGTISNRIAFLIYINFD
jgi:hypothetical protein